MQIGLPISSDVKRLIRSVYQKKEQLEKYLDIEGEEDQVGQEEREDVVQL